MLDKATLKSALQTIFEDLSNKTASEAAASMADAIEAFVKTGTVPAGIAITGTSPAGAVTGQTTSAGAIE